MVHGYRSSFIVRSPPSRLGRNDARDSRWSIGSIQSLDHEDCHLERERNPGPPRAIRGVGTEARPDMICLQEIKAKLDQIPESASIEGYTCYWHGAGGYSGVAMHVRSDSPRASRFTHPDFDHETRIVEAQIEDTVFTSVYVPNGGKDFEAKIAFLQLADRVRPRAPRARARAGPLRGHEHRPERHGRASRKSASHRRSASFRKSGRSSSAFSSVGGLVDVGRMLYPEDDDYFSWWAPWRNLRQRNIGWRLDYVLASESLAERARLCPSFREVGTATTPRSWPRSVTIRPPGQPVSQSHRLRDSEEPLDWRLTPKASHAVIVLPVRSIETSRDCETWV